jgi:hypothetical protein
MTLEWVDYVMLSILQKLGEAFFSFSHPVLKQNGKQLITPHPPTPQTFSLPFFLFILFFYKFENK